MADLDPSSLFNVKGLVAVVTGGGTGKFTQPKDMCQTDLFTGIGLMIAQALEANGAIVYILGRRQEVLEKAATTAVSIFISKFGLVLLYLKIALFFIFAVHLAWRANDIDTEVPMDSDRSVQKHGNIHIFRADVTSKSDLSAAVDHITSKSGYVNLVVANSGITGPTLRGLDKGASLTDFRNHLWNWDADEFNQTFALNTTAAFFTVVAFLELLDKGNKAGNVEQKSQVICVSSAGAFSRLPMAGHAYAGSKAAIIHIMKQLATSLVPYDIRSNVLAPGSKSYPNRFIPFD